MAARHGDAFFSDGCVSKYLRLFIIERQPMHSWSFECTVLPFYNKVFWAVLPGFTGIQVSIKTSLFTGNLGCEWEGAWHGYACFSDGCVEGFEIVQN